MLLTKFGPAFQETRKVPRGVVCGVPGGPGSMRTGPKLTWPPACSQVRCSVRSTHAVAVAGQDSRSRMVRTSGASAAWGAPVAVAFGGAVARAAGAADVPVRGPAGLADTTAAAVTTPTDAAATVSRPTACRTGPRARAGIRALEILLARLLAARMLALMSLLPAPIVFRTCTHLHQVLAHRCGFPREVGRSWTRRVARVRSVPAKRIL